MNFHPKFYLGQSISEKSSFQSLILLLGKSKPYPSEQEKIVQNEMKSKIDEVLASIEEFKNTPKTVVAFRATCAKNFPSGHQTNKSENPGKKFLLKTFFTFKF